MQNFYFFWTREGRRHEAEIQQSRDQFGPIRVLDPYVTITFYATSVYICIYGDFIKVRTIA